MSTQPGPDGFDASLARLTSGTARLLAVVGGLSDVDAAAPSALPGWSRGHVLTHLARNADGMGNLVVWARTGDRRPMYPSAVTRNADIDAGAGRPAGHLVADLADSAARLAQALADLADAPGEALDRTVEVGLGAGARPLPVRRMADVRLREVAVHHADLDLGYGPADWPDRFVSDTLELVTPNRAAPGGLAGIAALVATDGRRWSLLPAAPPGSDRVADGTSLTGPPQWLAAWLLGRAVPDVLTTSDGSPVPPPPPM